ncbi:hypothetical protein D3C86_1632860 [compost metagenome]
MPTTSSFRSRALMMSMGVHPETSNCRPSAPTTVETFWTVVMSTSSPCASNMPLSLAIHSGSHAAETTDATRTLVLAGVCAIAVGGWANASQVSRKTSSRKRVVIEVSLYPCRVSQTLVSLYKDTLRKDSKRPRQFLIWINTI